MLVKNLAAAVGAIRVVGAAVAAPVTYGIDFNATCPGRQPIIWNCGFTFDPDAVELGGG